MQLTQLNSKAMLVKLTRRQAGLVHRDREAELIAQDAVGDASLATYVQLFNSPNNPIKTIINMRNEQYAVHRKLTMPHTDEGWRLLPNKGYIDYCGEMRKLIQAVDSALDNHMPYWDKYVQDDIDFRNKNAELKGKVGRASVVDYPSADEFRTKMVSTLRFTKLPDKPHELFDQDAEEFDRALEDAVKLARREPIIRMLRPIQHLVGKLELPIGEKGSIFRDSAVENIIESVEQAKKLIVDDDDDEVKTIIKQVESVIAEYSDKVHWLRESPVNREAAAKKLAEVAAKMSMFN